MNSSVFFNIVQRQMNIEDSGKIVQVIDKFGHKHTISVSEVDINHDKEIPYRNNQVFPYSLGFHL